MKNTTSNTEQILSRNISGYHQYQLTDPLHVCYASDNLCQMTGFSREELLSDCADLYANLVHPADRGIYGNFLGRLMEKEQTLSARYRIVKKDGTVLYVNDTCTSARQADGTLAGFSVLADMTELQNENQNLRFLDETIPCGFLKYTCEKAPRITYMSRRMKQILRFPEASDDLDMYLQNIYLLIPMEERRRFAAYLDRVYHQGAPIAGEITVLRCDGSRAHLFGWVTRCVNDRGEEEFQSACMDITQRHHILKERQTQRYLKALTDIYDKIFEYDLSARTVRCLHGDSSPVFRQLENIPMQMEEATENWIMGTADEQDRERLHSFFQNFFQRKYQQQDGKPPQITYRALSSGGTMKTYTGIFLRLDGSVSLYCCRHAPDRQEADELRSENATLKNMQELAMRFTEGVVAFEIENDRVKPMYTSENVCSFFGYSREDWMALVEKRPTITEFISQSGIDYNDIQKLFATGEAEFTYFDMTQNAYRRIRAICSGNYNGDGHCYVMLYNLDAKEQEKTGPAVQIRTFGYFDVFVDDKPIAFRNEKSKELFALLVDRRGGFVSSEEAIGFLWEDEPANPVTLARYRKVALRLKNILEEYGIADIVESVNGKRRLVTEKIRCDLYDYLSGQEEFSQLFKGSYLSNYSWGENTLAQLLGEHLY